MEARLTGVILCISKEVMFLEFYNPDEKVFEYYMKEYNKHDFEYQFGVTEPFSVRQLTQLYDQGYFE